MQKLLCILIFFVTPIVLLAQRDSTLPYLNGKTELGIKLGFTESSFYGGDISALSFEGRTSYLNGFHLGVSINSKVSRNFWLKHELLLTRKGAQITLNDSVQNNSYQTKLKTLYLDFFPFSPTFYWNRFQIYVGPTLSMLVDARIQRKDSSGNFHTDKKIFGHESNFETNNKYLTKMDFGLAIGLEYEFKFGLNLGAKYVHGFSNVLQNANFYLFPDSKKTYNIYNHYLNISIGYSFVRVN